MYSCLYLLPLSLERLPIFRLPVRTKRPPLLKARQTEVAEAIFAGGCFWCVESDFDKVNGVVDTISGYTGGTLDNPTYKQVTYKDTGHYEAVKVVYDPSVVSYSELVEYFWRHVDPTDAGGQFCDRGDSYRTAIFAKPGEERVIAEASKAALEESGVLVDPVCYTNPRGRTVLECRRISPRLLSEEPAPL